MLNPRKELAIVANVLADKVNVKIEAGDGWKCNIETMTIYYPRNSWFGISDFGMIVHEAAHLRFSLFSKERFCKFIEVLDKEKEPLIGLHNVFENIRVNRLICQLYKGAKLYLDDFYYEHYLLSFDQYNNATTRKWYYWGKDEYTEYIKKNRWTGFCTYWAYYFEISEVHADSLIQFFSKDVVDAIVKSKKFIKENFPKVNTEEELLVFLEKILPYFLPLVADETKEDRKKKEEDKKKDEKKKDKAMSELMKKITEMFKEMIKDMTGEKDGTGEDCEEIDKEGGEGSKDGIGGKKEGEKSSDKKDGLRKIEKDNILGVKIEKEKFSLSSRKIGSDEWSKIFSIDRGHDYLTPEQLAKEVGVNLAQIRKSVSALKDSETNRYEGGYESGKIENRKLWKLMSTKKTRIFSRKIVDTNDNKDMAVAILADVSGSMVGEKCHAACVASTLLTKALEMSGKPVAVYSFNAYYKNHKQWNKKMDYKEMTEIENIIHDGTGTADNNDAYAVWKTAKELAKRPEKNKIMIVLSDGRPANSRGNSPEGREYRDFDLKEEAKKAEKIAKVYSVGIMDDNVSDYYERYVVIQDVKELAPIMMKFFKENAGKRRK